MLHVIIGCMFSGKTSTLISHIERHMFAKKSCLILNHSSDTRYGNNNIYTHRGVGNKNIPCVMVDKLDDIIVDNYDVICIDEGQFFPDLFYNVVRYLRMKKMVIVAGLNADFNQNPIGEMQKLIGLATNVTYLTAVCVSCGNDAQISHRKNNSNKEVNVVGSDDLYEARCFNCHQ